MSYGFLMMSEKIGPLFNILIQALLEGVTGNPNCLALASEADCAGCGGFVHQGQPLTAWSRCRTCYWSVWPRRLAIDKFDTPFLAHVTMLDGMHTTTGGFEKREWLQVTSAMW